MGRMKANDKMGAKIGVSIGISIRKASEKSRLNLVSITNNSGKLIVKIEYLITNI
jgi:hypothetical protein